MPTRTGYRPGLPCYADLSSPDVAASAAFYAAMFGWRAERDHDPDAGGYTRFTLRGVPVAGAGPTFAADRPSTWNTYFAAEDAECAALRVKEAGGQVVTGPAQVADEGTMAVFQDPEGAAFLVWQAGRCHGARLVDEPASPCGFELWTRDPVGAMAFYPEVFGWETRGGQDGEPGAVWLADGRRAAGLRPMEDGVPPEVPAHWLVHFGVADCDDAADLGVRCGGRVLREPRDLPSGRRAVLADPFGARFAVLAAARAR
ncbi:VOC family protein [Sphaerisporangium sp. B11E5]|uniref:VOC family protein n=1 Tax=Sphaerisporangium sp. B11E5 TaxID=3153563 RepID=UPI00325F73A1